MHKTGTYFGTKNGNLFRHQKLESVSVPKSGTYLGATNGNIFWRPKLEPENKSFWNICRITCESLSAATWAATATHPHSCAQPRAQLLEACAWQKFGTSGDWNLKRRVVETCVRSQMKAMGAAT